MTTSPGVHVKIRSFLGRKRHRGEHNPHKAAPDVYFKHIYFTKPLYEGFEYISKELKRQSVGKTANELMAITIREFMAGIVRDAARYEVELNELYRRGIDEKSMRLWIALFRGSSFAGSLVNLPGAKRKGLVPARTG